MAFNLNNQFGMNWLCDQRGIRDPLGTSAQILVFNPGYTVCKLDMGKLCLVPLSSQMPPYTLFLPILYHLPINKNLKWVCSVRSDPAKGGKCSEKTKAGRTGLHLNRMNMKGFTKGNTQAKVLKGRGWVLPITGENHPTWKNICKCPGAEACLVQNNKEVAAAKADMTVRK